MGTEIFFPLASSAREAGDEIPFRLTVVDEAVAGDVKLVGDIDGDDLPDLVIGGNPDEKLNWYRYPDWTKTVIATPSVEFTTDGALGDVDGDGDLDIVVPDGPADENLVWFENPRPAGDPAVGDQWQVHTIGSVDGWGKDVELADYDNDGLLDVATRNDTLAMIYFQQPDGGWLRMNLDGMDTGLEGMANGDIDGDGHVDLVLHGVWVRNPGPRAARDATRWAEHTIGEADSTFKALVVDINQDGRMDVAFSSSEGSADVNWWSPTTDDATGPWQKHTVVPMMERTHTLQAADMDLDGDLDFVLAQMHTSRAAEIMVMLNTDGQATTWQKQLVGTGGIHNGVVADVGNDGDFDIFGANWTGNPPVRLWENRLSDYGPLDRWSYQRVTRHNQQTFGLAFADIDHDGLIDIASGSDWYRNPGVSTGAWTQTALPQGMHAILATDVDNDGNTDIIAQQGGDDLALYWLEADDHTGEVGTAWGWRRAPRQPRSGSARVSPGPDRARQQARVLISSGSSVYYFVAHTVGQGDWPRVHVNANPSDEGLAAGDVDGDGLLDIAATTGDSKRVEWYQNPGDGSDDWAAHVVATFDDAVYPDRTEVADLNGDGRLDVVVTEENGADGDAQTFWWEQPADVTATPWPICSPIRPRPTAWMWRT
ncbi:MAG: VCBS repeat-containing protein [Caldilineaceae bacterium]